MRWSKRKNIRGTIILDETGLPIQTDFSSETTTYVSSGTLALLESIRTFVECLDEGGLYFVKLETTRGEVLVIPEKSKTSINII
nr:roadblock/LC7 domain-containing protein [Candidatus Sigynarchaeota archaeon]